MSKKVVGWTIVLSFILCGAHIAAAQPAKAPVPFDVVGGADDQGNWWYLTDESQVTLEDGDFVMVIWTGDDGVIDPPVRAQGSPYNGWVTGDDFRCLVDPDAAQILYGGFYVPVGTWAAGDLDSLGRQRHPMGGEWIYVRVFNSADRVTATHYGNSGLYQTTGIAGEVYYAVMPNDPDGPTTDQEIFGRFFKVIGGIDPSTGTSYKLRDPDADLEDGDAAQLIWVGPDGEVDAPSSTDRMPGDDDVLVDSWGVNEGMDPATGTGTFRKFSATYDTSSHGRPAEGDLVYVRLFNSDNLLEATYYGDSPTYTVAYVIGESLSVFYDDAVDCSTFITPLDAKDFTIYGGTDPATSGSWPLIDGTELKLQDDDLVQLIWAGPDSLIDAPDATTGMPTGDDSLLTSVGIGYGYPGTNLGRFKIAMYSYETHKKAGFPAQGDFLYVRVFDAPTVGEDVGGGWYGDSEVYEVQWEFGEKFYSFPDSTIDADTQVPWYRGITIYGGLDTAMVEYPLTDSFGVVLEDDYLVQLIWTGPDAVIAPLDSLTGMPTDDDSVVTTWGVGEGYGADTGLFMKELQTYSGHKGGFPAQGDFIYLRVFNAVSLDDATHYGQSDLHEVAYEVEEEFFSFPDAENDVIHRFRPTSVEWADPGTSLPTEYALFQNYPNPFNPQTDIRYNLPQAAHVRLAIYNVLGQEVVRLVDGERDAGGYTIRWLGTDSQGREVSAGLYFYRLQAGDFTSVRKMVLLK